VHPAKRGQDSLPYFDVLDPIESIDVLAVTQYE